MTTPDGAFAPGCMLYFELKGRDGTVIARRRRPSDLSTTVAEKSYTVTLAVSLGQIKTLIENSVLHDARGDPGRRENPLRVAAGGIRLSLGLEDWHDIIADLEDALEVV